MGNTARLLGLFFLLSIVFLKFFGALRMITQDKGSLYIFNDGFFLLEQFSMKQSGSLIERSTPRICIAYLLVPSKFMAHRYTSLALSKSCIAHSQTCPFSPPTP